MIRVTGSKPATCTCRSGIGGRVLPESIQRRARVAVRCGDQPQQPAGCRRRAAVLHAVPLHAGGRTADRNSPVGGRLRRDVRFAIRSAWSVRGLGVPLPANTEWDLKLDYMSLRGPALGTLFNYDHTGSLFGMPTRNSGFGNMYYVNDSGQDNLGFGRRSLDVPTQPRPRDWRNRTIFGENTWLSGTRLDAELGYVSDRNFREQYFENDSDARRTGDADRQPECQFDNLTCPGCSHAG